MKVELSYAKDLYLNVMATVVHNLHNLSEAIIYLDSSEVPEGTVAQVQHMLSSAAVDHARVMPDCQLGTGCCVGFTSKLTEAIMPSYIGGDIGCGISLYTMDAKTLCKVKKTQLSTVIL